MSVIWKYETEIVDYVNFDIPKEGKILSVQIQHGTTCIWVLIDPSQPKEKRYFKIAGTGHPITEPIETLDFIGTFQMVGGSLIFHLFELQHE